MTVFPITEIFDMFSRHQLKKMEYRKFLGVFSSEGVLHYTQYMNFSATKPLIRTGFGSAKRITSFEFLLRQIKGFMGDFGASQI